MPKVSIILTTHGPAPYLKQAIGSVLAQTFEDWECWIVQDAPSIHSLFPRELDGLADDRISRFAVKVTTGVSCRFAYTINQAFKQCRGDYITYLCHDDLYLPWRLAEMVGFLNCFPDRDVCFGYQHLLDEIPNGVWFTREGNPDQPAGTVDHSSVMHRRECFEKAGGWDENAPARYGDAYFWLRLQNAGYKFHCIPEELDVHRFNQHSISWKLDHPEAESAKA